MGWTLDVGSPRGHSPGDLLRAAQSLLGAAAAGFWTARKAI